MREVWLSAIAATVCGLATPLCAGVYQTFDAVPSPAVTKEGIEPVPFRLFRDDPLKALLQVLVDQPPAGEITKFVGSGIVGGGLARALDPPRNVVRERHLRLRDELLRKERTGRATEEDLVNLSACLIRLNEPDRAVAVLTPRAGRECRNFMLLANLATANYLGGQGERARLTRALDILDQAFDVWPKEWKGLTPEQLEFYRRAETLFRDLLRARRLELSKPTEERTGLDPLFGPRDNPARFVGEAGQYEAGSIGAAERAKLPKDAVALVQQLLVWLPHDTRLYWLYGELLNAQGNVREAREALDDCVYVRRYHADDLQAHRQILNEAVAEAAAESRRIGWLPERWQLYAVGGLAGLLVVALLYFQVRELRRRQHAAGKG